MVNEEFLDTNIVVNYINYNENSKEIVKKSHNYVLRITGEIILCCFVIKELKNLINKKSRIHKAVLKKIENEGYDLSKELNSRESPYAKKLYVKFRDFGIKKLSEIFIQERILFQIGIEKFLKFNVEKIVINIPEIDLGLVSKIGYVISNIDDCKVLASALQHQKTEDKIFNFVTADGKDLDPNGYEYLKEHFEINYSKEGYRFPNLVNLMYS